MKRHFTFFKIAFTQVSVMLINLSSIRTTDAEKTSAFYQEVFGLKRVGLGQNGIYLSDGYINLAILKCRPVRERGGGKIGIEHFGFQVEDVEGTLAKLDQHGGISLGNRVDVTPKDAFSPQSYYELKCVGPDDQIIDVSGSGWVGTD